jgi:hypothetical protein
MSYATTSLTEQKAMDGNLFNAETRFVEKGVIYR